jgi:hypothetical protein
VVPVSGTARVRRRVVLGAVATAVAGMLGGCARQEAPPGGPEDRRPPVVVRTVPEAFDTVSDLREVRFDFDERISERVAGGSLNEAVTVSPRGGDVRVSHSRRSLSVRVEGGFEEGLVYRVTLRPAVSDLFGNQLADPFELVFSTGGALVPTTLAGEVWDRITGSNTSDALVLASEGPESPVHQSVTDREGIFALRYLPSGRVTVTAFEDVNRNGVVDSTEVQGATTAELVSGDTLIIDLPVLAPDTAAAVALSADAIDSVTVVVEFDDYLEPSSQLDGIDVALRREGAVAPAVVRRFHEADYRAFVEAVADSFARLDSIDRVRAADREVSAGPDEPGPVPGDTAAPLDTAALLDTVALLEVPADTVAPPADTVLIDLDQERADSLVPLRVPPTRLEPLQGSAPGPTADGRRVLPGRRIVLQLDEPLPIEEPFELDVAGVVNINGLPGGGGTVELVREPPPPDSTALADSAAVPDTGLAGDTAAVPDTGRVGDASAVGAAGLARMRRRGGG